jgi:hypothetical protein
MTLTFTLVHTWDDGKRVHVAGTAAASGNYSTDCDTLDPSQFPVIATTQAPVQGTAWMDGMAGGESWTRIARLEVREADTFIPLNFSNEESLDVTPHHIFTLADGSPMRAERSCLSDVFVGRFGRITLKRIEAIVEAGKKGTAGCGPTHQFFAGRHAASVLTQNYTFSP